MKIQFLGQNCFLITYNNITILTDPFYNFSKEKSQFNIDDHKVDYVLITHAHGDHVSDVEEVLSKYPEAIVVGQPEICGHFGHAHNVDLNFGGTLSIEALKISMVSALHTSSFPNGNYGGLASGYVFQLDGKNLYFAGDTAVTVEMSLLQDLFGTIDLAILPVGGHYTMNAKMAAFASKNLIKTSRVIGCHFDTFPPIAIDHEEAYNAFKEYNISLTLPRLGEQFDF